MCSFHHRSRSCDNVYLCGMFKFDLYAMCTFLGWGAQRKLHTIIQSTLRSVWEKAYFAHDSRIGTENHWMLRE